MCMCACTHAHTHPRTRAHPRTHTVLYHKTTWTDHKQGQAEKDSGARVKTKHGRSIVLEEENVSRLGLKESSEDLFWERKGRVIHHSIIYIIIQCIGVVFLLLLLFFVLFLFVCFNYFLIPSDPWAQPLERGCIVYRRKVAEYHCHAVVFSEWDRHAALVWHSCRRPRLLSVLVFYWTHALFVCTCTVPVTASEAITTCKHPSLSALLCVLPCGDIFQTSSSSFFVRPDTTVLVNWA